MKKTIRTMMITLLLLVTLSLGQKADAEPAEFKLLNVNETEDIQSSSNGEYAVVDIPATHENKDYGKENFYYTFQLKDAAYVKLSNYANIFEYNFNGDVTIYLSQTKTFTNKVCSGWACGTQSEFSTLLEAGTYYVKIEVDYKSSVSYAYLSEPTNTFAVYAEYLPSQNKCTGISKKSAIELKTGHKGSSNVSFYNRTKYFKINLSSKSNVIFQCNSVAKEGWDKKSLTQKNGILWTVYNENGEKLATCATNESTVSCDKEHTQENYATFDLSSLNAAVYYIAASCPIDVPESSLGVFEVNCIPIVLKTPNIKSVTRKSSTSMNVTLANKVPSVTGYEIIYSTSKDMKDVKSVKIGKNASLTKTIQHLKAGTPYFVQVRSYYKDAKGNVYLGNFSKRKCVHK